VLTSGVGVISGARTSGSTTAFLALRTLFPVRAVLLDRVEVFFRLLATALVSFRSFRNMFHELLLASLISYFFYFKNILILGVLFLPVVVVSSARTHALAERWRFASSRIASRRHVQARTASPVVRRL